MFQSTRFYVPDIDELEYYLNPDNNKYHRLDREGIKLLFSYAMDVWPTDNEVSSTKLTEHWNLGSFGSSLGCGLSYCKGNDVVFVLFEKYFDKGNEGINIFIKDLREQYKKKKFLFIIIPKDAPPKVSKNEDNIIYLDYSDFLRWRHDCELMSLTSYWADCQLESPKDYLEFAEKTTIGKELKGHSEESIYKSFIEIFANSIQLLKKEQLINIDSEDMKIIIKKDKILNLMFVGQWCWGMLHYLFPERERLQWDYFEDTFIYKGKGLGIGKIKRGHENYIEGCCRYLKKELSKTGDVNFMSETLKNIKKHPEKYKFLRDYWDYLSNFCDNNKIPNSLKNLLLNILSWEMK